ncbi:hypothetical protein Dimus_001247 [Dionaea muscipula]
MSHNRKNDISRSSVRGVEIKFDHMKLASILGIPGNNGICEYIKEVWEESRYTKPLEITRKFANDETIIEARRFRGNPDQMISSLMLELMLKTSYKSSSCSSISRFTRGLHNTAERKDTSRSRPLGIPETVMIKLQAEFERAHANRIQSDLEKAQAENARLLALLQQAKNSPKP